MTKKFTFLVNFFEYEKKLNSQNLKKIHFFFYEDTLTKLFRNSFD